MCNAKSPYSCIIYIQCTKLHVAPQEPIAASQGGAHRLPYLFLAMVKVMEVVGIDKIKLLHNFFKIERYFYRLSASSPAIFSDFDMSKKSKITKSVLVPLFRWTCHAASSRLPVSEVKYSRRKYRGFNRSPTAVYAPSCLYLSRGYFASETSNRELAGWTVHRSNEHNADFVVFDFLLMSKIKK